MTNLLRIAAFVAGVLATALAQAQPAAARVERVGDAIHFRGRIDAPSAATFLQLLQDAAVKRLVITSPGGLVTSALDMAEAIHARELDLEVPEACLSSCANYIVPAARRKRLGSATAVGWHGNMSHVLYLHQVGERHWSEAELEAARSLARRENAFFRKLGVDGFVCWFGKLAPYAVDEFFALTPRDMALFGIRDISVDPAARADTPGVRLLEVDPHVLQRIRPIVRVDS